MQTPPSLRKELKSAGFNIPLVTAQKPPRKGDKNSEEKNGSLVMTHHTHISGDSMNASTHTNGPVAQSAASEDNTPNVPAVPQVTTIPLQLLGEQKTVKTVAVEVGIFAAKATVAAAISIGAAAIISRISKRGEGSIPDTVTST